MTCSSCRIGGDMRRLVAQYELAEHAVRFQRITLRVRDVSHDPVEIDAMPLRGLLAAREREQILHDLRGALRLAVHGLDGAAIFLRETRLQEDLREARDGGQRVVQLMCHTRKCVPRLDILSARRTTASRRRRSVTFSAMPSYHRTSP